MHVELKVGMEWQRETQFHETIHPVMYTSDLTQYDRTYNLCGLGCSLGRHIV
jgi:hypothetical protein